MLPIYIILIIYFSSCAFSIMPSSSRQAMALIAETTSIFSFKHILFNDKGSIDKASYIFCPVSSSISRAFMLFSTISLLFSFNLIFKSYCKSEIMSRDDSSLEETE